MKKLTKFVLSVVLPIAFTLPAFASTTYVTAPGFASELCSSGPVGDACIQSVKINAEKDALKKADWTCQDNQGESQLDYTQCNSSCTPTYVPPANGPTMIRCNSTCTIQCDL